MADFQEYIQALPQAELNNYLFPINILNDIDILYSYTEEEFIIRGVPVIESMIYNVCYTIIGTREFEPEFGSRLLIMIQEPLTRNNMEIIEMELFRAVKRWVPYCSLMFRQTYCVGYPDQGLVVAYINYVDIFKNIPRTFILNLSASQIA